MKHSCSDEALLFLGDVRERLTVVVLGDEEYVEMLQRAAEIGLIGGGIYDAILARCAVKAKAEAIYTWNAKHFNRLGADVAERVKTP